MEQVGCKKGRFIQHLQIKTFGREQGKTMARKRHKWTIRTSASTPDYIKGVKNPRRSWGKTCCESAGRYKSGADKAHSRGAFKRGVKKRGLVGWRAKTLLKGPSRFYRGVVDGANTYARGYGPYHAHFPSIFLPKRFPRGDPRNIGRVGAVATAMGRLKMSMAGTGKVTCPND